jgi:hypothetical protein
MANSPQTFVIFAEKRREISARVEERHRRLLGRLNRTDELLERSRRSLARSRQLLSEPVLKIQDATSQDITPKDLG